MRTEQTLLTSTSAQQKSRYFELILCFLHLCSLPCPCVWLRLLQCLGFLSVSFVPVSISLRLSCWVSHSVSHCASHDVVHYDHCVTHYRSYLFFLSLSLTAGRTDHNRAATNHLWSGWGCVSHLSRGQWHADFKHSATTLSSKLSRVISLGPLLQRPHLVVENVQNTMTTLKFRKRQSDAMSQE